MNRSGVDNFLKISKMYLNTHFSDLFAKFQEKLILDQKIAQTASNSYTTRKVNATFRIFIFFSSFLGHA